MLGNYKYKHQDKIFFAGLEEMGSGRVTQWTSTLSVIFYLKTTKNSKVRFDKTV